MTKSAGFTLIEMAVAVFIIALLAGRMLVPLVSQHEQRQVRDTEKMLAEAREALLGFAAVNGYLPCPDSTVGAGANDGQEDVVGAACAVTAGNLPHVTLGIQNPSDPWGNRLRYRVVPAYAQRTPPVVSLTTPADLRVCLSSVCPTKAEILTDFDPAQPPGPLNPPGHEAVAIILSHGKNGLGAVNYLTGAANMAPTRADELANLGAGSFVSRTPSGLGSAADEFDDIVTWLGRSTLFKMMVAAGRLP